MTRRKAAGYLHKKSSGIGYAVTTDEGSGKRVYTYFPGRYDSTESRAAFHAWLAQRDKRATPAAGVYSCQQVAALFLERQIELHDLDDPHGRAKYGEWTKAAELLATFGERPINDLRLPDIVSLQDALAGGVYGPLSAYSINTRINRILGSRKKPGIIAWATRKGYCERVMSEVYELGLEPVSEDTHPGITPARTIEAADPAEIDTLRPYLSPTVAAMVDLQILAGFRAGELVQLRWELIEKDDPKRPGVWSFEPPRHKNKWRKRKSKKGKHHRRVIFIGPQAQEILLQYESLRPVRDAEYIFTPRESAAHCFLVASQRFAESPSKWYKWSKPKQLANWQAAIESAKGCSWQFTTHTYRQSIHHGCKRAGIENINTHPLRYLFAQNIVSRYDQETAAAALGDTLDAALTYTGKNHDLAARAMAERG